MLTRYFPYREGLITGHGPSQVIYYIVQELSQLGVKIDVIAEGRNRSSISRGFTIHYTYPPYEFYSFLKRIRIYSHKFHVVHSHTMICSSHAFYGLFNKSSPFILQLHHSILESNRKSLRLNTLFHFANLILALNSFEANGIRRCYNIAERKINVIFNGVDAELFKPMEKQGQELKKKLGLSGKRIVLSVGRPSPSKGFEYLLKAMSNIINEIPDIHLLLVGLKPESQIDMKYIHHLQERSRSLGITNHITVVTDFIPHNKLAAFYSAADIYVLPSLNEVFNLTLLEAMSCGIPVIATTVGAAPNVITKNVGILVSPRNADELTDAITNMFTEYEMERMGTNARNFVLRQFTWRKVALRLLRIYREVSSVILT